MDKLTSVPYKRRVFWDLSRKITLLVFAVTSITFVAFLQFVNFKMSTNLKSLALDSYTSTTQLLADTVSPAVRWKKSSKIEETFNHLIAQQGNALSGMYTFNLPGDEQFSLLLSADETRQEYLHKLVAPYAVEIASETQTINTPTDLIIVMPILNPKDGQPIGGIASIWDIQPIQSTVKNSSNFLIKITLVTLVCLAVLLCIVISRSVGKRIKAGVKVANSIAKGNYDNNIVIKSNDELGQLDRALEGVQISLKAGDDSERRAQESGRIKQALDFASSCTILADHNHDIVYVNHSAERLFSLSEPTIGKLMDVGKLNNDSLVGLSLEVFSRYPQLCPMHISGLNNVDELEITEDGLSLLISISPVFDHSGQRTGTVLEWYDRTQEVRAELELQESVDAAAQGDFTRRIAVDSMSGFHAHVANMLNNMAEITESGMNDTLHVLQSLATGDLNARISSDHQGIFSRLRDNTNATTDKLKSIVGDIRMTAFEVNEGASSIAKGNQDLSNRTEQQAAHLEETAAAMQELTTTVQNNTENVRHASKLASSTQEEAINGGDLANKAVCAVLEISQASKKIADIIGVIDEIAFQTNLLALNASVEAARAGEKGRGFAVVASEVRDLAGRSASAAKEIKELIGDSVTKVEEGEKLVSESGEALKTIVDSVRKVSGIVSDIANASSEQIQGIDQINNAIMRIDDMTQKNAAMVERQASASQKLGSQAQHMDKMVRYFKTDTADEYQNANDSLKTNSDKAA